MIYLFEPEIKINCATAKMRAQKMVNYNFIFLGMGVVFLCLFVCLSWVWGVCLLLILLCCDYVLSHIRYQDMLMLWYCCCCGLGFDFMFCAFSSAAFAVWDVPSSFSLSLQFEFSLQDLLTLYELNETRRQRTNSLQSQKSIIYTLHFLTCTCTWASSRKCDRPTNEPQPTTSISSTATTSIFIIYKYLAENGNIFDLSPQSRKRSEEIQ